MATGTVLQQQINQLFRVVQASKLPAELTLKNRIVDKDERFVVQKGVADAENVKIQHLRGFLGDFNASTNTATLPDASLSFSLSNAIGIAGDWVKVTTAGTVDFGAGNVEMVIGDVLRYDGTQWSREFRKPIPFTINVASDGVNFTVPGPTPSFIDLYLDRLPQIDIVDYTLLNNEITMENTVYTGSILTGVAHY